MMPVIPLFYFGAFTIAAAVWALTVEPNAFKVRNFQIRLSKPVRQSYRILHLTDIHFAGERPALSEFFDQLARETYDFVFLTGDIFDSAEGVPHAVRELGKLKPAFGMFGVWGNHDYYDYRFSDVVNMSMGSYPKKKNPIDVLEDAVKKAGVRLLKNETVEIRNGGDVFLIHGLDDPTTGRSDVPRIAENAHPHKINMLLTHSIDAFQELPHDRMHLSFSGHSHGGQVRLPGVGAVITHTKYGRNYAAGLKRLKGSACSISQGLGTSRFFPVRFFCRPEAIVVEIRP